MTDVPTNMLQWPSAKLMGAEFVALDEATQTVEMAFMPPPEFANVRGTVQGGLIAGFLDEVMGAAVFVAHGGALQLTLDINLSLLRPVPFERLTAKARVVKPGRRVTFVESELFDASGKLCARATATTMGTSWPGAEKAGPDA